MKLIFFAVFVLCVVIGLTLLSRASVFGERPSDEERLSFARSPNFNPKTQKFFNRRSELVNEMYGRFFTNPGIILKAFATVKDKVPSKPLPEVKPDLQQFLSLSDDVKVIWFGHSTLLFNFGGKTVLIDPVFSGSASPVSFTTKRFQKPVLSLAELPKIDFIVISHDHYDHLDMTTIKFFRNSETQFVTPLGVGSHLVRWGIARSRITELDWWQTTTVSGLEMTAAPAQHASGRGFRRDETLWSSWIIADGKHNIFYSGDSGYDTHFKQIGDKYGPFDVAFLENGQYGVDWSEVHMLPGEPVRALRDLKAKRLLPVHWGMFVLAFHSWYEPIEKLSEEADANGVELLTPMLGEIVELGAPIKTNKWWK